MLDTKDGRGSGEADGGLAFRPLYRQVRDKLIRRLADGEWAPGAPLPSEMQLAAEFGVSQGTVRKALDALAAENLVVRRQGRGTFVARHDEERIMFQFFKLVHDTGKRIFPESRLLSLTRSRSNAAERANLILNPSATVVRIRRLRSIDGRPAIVETLTLPEALFPDIADLELPNNLYGLYVMRFGIAVARAQEKLKAVSASDEEAAILDVEVGTPLLQINRLALSLDQVPVEWRLSVCRTDHLHYLTDMR